MLFYFIYLFKYINFLIYYFNSAFSGDEVLRVFQLRALGGVGMENVEAAVLVLNKQTNQF